MPGPNRPEILQQDSVTIVAFGPDFDRITELNLAAAATLLQDAVATGSPRIVVDLSQTTFFSSSFIEVLFRAWNKVQPKSGGRLAICGLTPYCREILQVTNLDQLWSLYETRDDAVAALKPAAK